jgi:hypothetical protein
MADVDKPKLSPAIVDLRVELRPVSGSLPDRSPGRLNDENSRGKLQNVRGNSTEKSELTVSGGG